MAGAVFWAALGVGVACVGIAVVVYAFMYARGRRVGTRGLVQRSRLSCPKCHREFDYDWVPGASFTAVRLGPSRYMACPLCRRWSMFDLYGGIVARPTADAGPTRSPPAEPPGGGRKAPPPTGP